MLYVNGRRIPEVADLDSICRIERLLAVGGMSSVYLATGKGDCEGMTLAVKSCLKDSPYEMALKKEYNILKSIDNPHVPKVYGLYDYTDRFTGDMQTGLVMEFVEGKSLADILREDASGEKEGVKIVDDEFIFNVITSLCNVLSYLHCMKHPMYYCDVKPDNIIISKNTVKVIDFGSARAHSGTFIRERMVHDGNVRYGTVSYAAPEQFDAEGIIDARTDIYGIGRLLAVLYERYGSRPKIIDRIIQRCLYEERKRRYADVSEFMCDFLKPMRKNGVIKAVIIYR